MAQPASSYLPSGLNDGDVFRLIFVTNGGMTCLNGQPGGTQINTYNNFVQDEEWTGSSIRTTIEQYLGVSITFKCIASTLAVNAKDNIVPDSPTDFVGVYKLDGTKIVDTTNDLWIPPLDNPIDLDQTGSLLSGTNNVWTGTGVDGEKDGYLGQVCANCINVGSSSEADSGWINATTVPSCPGGTPPKTFTPYQII